MLKAVSLFSGCGGFDLGVKRTGVEIIWANDIDPHAASAYASLHPHTIFENKDIKKISDFPEADILIGCYPCTGFSKAARRRWKNLEDRDLHKNDTNFLFEEFLRAIDLVNPKLIFVENVRGMLSADNGYFLRCQLEGLASRGFTNIAPFILNAADYGVPQTRERVFFACLHSDFNETPAIPPLPIYGKKAGNDYKTLADAISDMDEWPIGEFYEGKFHGHYLTRNRKRDWSAPSYTIVANGHHVPLHPSGEPMKFISKDKWSLQGNINRRLSWRECSRIQGLPDTIEIEGDLMDKYRVVGNSVPPDLAYAVSNPLVQTLKSKL